MKGRIADVRRGREANSRKVRKLPFKPMKPDEQGDLGNISASDAAAEGS